MCTSSLSLSMVFKLCSLLYNLQSCNSLATYASIEANSFVPRLYYCPLHYRPPYRNRPTITTLRIETTLSPPPSLSKPCSSTTVLCVIVLCVSVVAYWTVFWISKLPLRCRYRPLNIFKPLLNKKRHLWNRSTRKNCFLIPPSPDKP